MRTTAARLILVTLCAVAAAFGVAGCVSGKHLSAAPQQKATSSASSSIAFNIPTDIPPAPVSYPPDTPTPSQTRNYAAKFGVPYDVSGTGPDGVTPISAEFTVSAPVLDASFYDGYSKPKLGQFVSFSLRLKSATNGFDYNEWDWYVRGANGAHYDPAAGKDPALTAGTAHKGELVTGYVSFDAPRHGTLVYSPNFSGESIGEWVF
jgi:hypothetical protein